MIVKELDAMQPHDAREQAGRAAEEQMAFYLRRAFVDDTNFLVFNGLRYERAQEAAQLDHVVLHRCGLMIVESKSVSTRVEINTRGEWTRWYGRTPKGMASPVLQVQRQADFLRSYLDDVPEVLSGKVAGISTCVAISDNGVIKRPKDMELDEVRKADQIPVYIREVMQARRVVQAMPRVVGRVLAAAVRGRTSDTLSPDEVSRLSEFLFTHHRPLMLRSSESPMPPRTDGSLKQKSREIKEATPSTVCRHCGGSKLSVEFGYSYFFKCRTCQGNTAISPVCETCGGPARVRKKGQQFFADCLSCRHSQLFHVNPSEGVSAG